MSDEIQPLGSTDGWSVKDKSEEHSTVAYFMGGALCTETTETAGKGDTVHIWKGVQERDEDGLEIEDEYVLEGYEDESDGKPFVVEYTRGNKNSPIATRFADTFDEAVRKAVQLQKKQL